MILGQIIYNFNIAFLKIQLDKCSRNFRRQYFFLSYLYTLCCKYQIIIRKKSLSFKQNCKLQNGK